MYPQWPFSMKKYHDLQTKVINNRQDPPDGRGQRFRVMISREASDWRLSM
jgi:hypothetical protein